MTASRSGTKAARIAPKAMTRMMNVAGRLIRRDPSRSSVTTVPIWSLVRVFDTAWIPNCGAAAWAASIVPARTFDRISRSAAAPRSRAVRITPAPSGAIRPAAGGAWYGSITSLKAGPVAPPMSAVAALSWLTTLSTVVRKAGSVTLAVWLVITIVACSEASAADPALIAWLPARASVFEPPTPPVAETVRMPPLEMLRTNSPIVRTNHRTKTGQR